jgi:beta-phosphoglucomutase family hydrolase
MSERGLAAVIWDMDGVIADTGDFHYRAWVKVFGERGVSFKKEDFIRFFGRRHDTIIHFALGDDISQEEFDKVTAEKQQLYRDLVRRNVIPLPGAVELVRALNAAKIPTAIATSAPYPNIDVILDGLGIKDCFQAIASGLEVTESKPDPAVYLLAARKLGVDPARCVVFEDAVAGVAAARNAGMKCIGVTNSHPGESLRQADRVVDSLTEVTLDDLRALFK